MNYATIERRRSLKGSTATLAVTALQANGMNLTAPSKSMLVAPIGTGWYGKSDLFRLIQEAPVEVVAFCDVDKNMLEGAAQLVSQRQKSKNQPTLYGEDRKMLAENKLGIVLIGRPDHWHALQPIDTMKAGAHVYVQKSISVDVIEGEAMVAAARKSPATRYYILSFLAAIEHEGRPVADIEEGHISIASCIIANMSMKLGRPLVYNPKKRKFITDAKANALVRRPYRSPNSS